MKSTSREDQRAGQRGREGAATVRVIVWDRDSKANDNGSTSPLPEVALAQAATSGVEIVRVHSQEDLLAAINAGVRHPAGSVVLLDLGVTDDWTALANALPCFDHRHIVWLALIGGHQDAAKLARRAAHLNSMEIATPAEAAAFGILLRQIASHLALDSRSDRLASMIPSFLKVAGGRL